MQIHQIPIINYHKISPSYDIGITTRHPVDFENDLKIIQKHKFHSITFKDLLNPQTITENPIIITFDDAYETLLKYALPILQKYGFRSVIYPVTNFVGLYNDWDVQIGSLKYRHLDWNELKDLQNLGFEIGSHTKSHELLTWMNKDQRRNELIGSREKLRDALGQEIYSVSYPFGRFNQDTIAATVEAGYAYGLASIYFRNLTEQDQRYALKRFNIYRFDTKEHFESKIALKDNNGIFYRDWIIQKGGIGTAILQSIRKQIRGNGKLTKDI